MPAFQLGSAHTLVVKKWPQVVALFCGILLPLLLLGELAEDVWEDKGEYRFAFDEPILHFLHARATPHRDSLWSFVTDFGRPPLMLAMGACVVGFLWIQKRRGDAAFFLASVTGAAILNVVAKLVFGRTRPDLWISIAPETSFSFPSGHAMATMAMAAALVVLAWPARGRFAILAGAIVFVVAVGLSRLYLGVHYPSDVLGGWCAALAWVSGLAAIRSRRSQREKSTPE